MLELAAWPPIEVGFLTDQSPWLKGQDRTASKYAQLLTKLGLPSTRTRRAWFPRPVGGRGLVKRRIRAAKPGLLPSPGHGAGRRHVTGDRASRRPGDRRDRRQHDIWRTVTPESRASSRPGLSLRAATGAFPPVISLRNLRPRDPQVPPPRLPFPDSRYPDSRFRRESGRESESPGDFRFGPNRPRELESGNCAQSPRFPIPAESESGIGVPGAGDFGV